MRDFEDALLHLLLNGLVAQAYQENFRIEDSAAEFFAGRALSNIKARHRDREAMLLDVLHAIRIAPEFIARIRREHDRNAIVSSDMALASIPTKDCIFPWCSR